MRLSDLTLFEMKLLVELDRTKSIRELARREGQLPSQVSKAIKRLEQKTGRKLIERSVQGVVLTVDGHESLPVFRGILEKAECLEDKNRNVKTPTLVGVGSTSFLINHLLVPVLATLKPADVRFRFLEITPDLFTSAGLRHAFEMAFHYGKIEWPGTWHQEKVGDSNWNLCCRKGHPLLSRKNLQLKDVLQFPFVIPSYWTQEGFALGNDGCPIPLSKRIKGDETATAEAAMAIVRRTDQIAYLPDILIRNYEELGEVQTLKVKGGSGDPRPLYIAVRSDLISEKLFQEIVKRTKAAL